MVDNWPGDQGHAAMALQAGLVLTWCASRNSRTRTLCMLQEARVEVFRGMMIGMDTSKP